MACEIFSMLFTIWSKTQTGCAVAWHTLEGLFFRLRERRTRIMPLYILRDGMSV